ncbi:uncharacterized protein L201_002986 [Kwoniella dendrophila CBS 6074]|uniref:F-box domain-containing protein n=1 Tax=Kwoniella dendrophila CBS 6074 TaxID=1295534 RepID=A0AAX4JRQ1_9TREE
MTSTPTSSKTTCLDPLDVLGPSLFLQTLSNLSLDSLTTCLSVCESWNYIISESITTLYKPIAYEIGVEPDQLKMLEMIEKATASQSLWSSDPDEPFDEPIPEDEPSGSVNWKGIVKSYLTLQNNWKSAKAKSHWIYPGRNTIWRLKIDKEEGTIITTSRIDGILVSDLKTSEPLFEYEDVAPYAHLEFVKGYAIFNANNERSFEIHLTPTALRKLSPEKRKKIPSNRSSITHDTGYSFALNNHYEPTINPLNKEIQIPPKGHLTYFKTLTPRTECFAFRARIDKEFTSDEKLVFGTSSDEEAYIFDLQSESSQEMERFVFDHEDRGRPNYIEFDDNFLFICHRFSVNVYSRITKKKLTTFPPPVTAPFDAASAIYTCYDVMKVRKLKHDNNDDEKSNNLVLAGELDIQGKWIDDNGFEGVMMSSGQGRIDGREFSAIHYTSRDLFAITRSGTLYVLRNYHEVFSIQNAEARDKAVNANSLAIVLRQRLLHLSTHGEHVIFSSPNSVFLLHTSSLPLGPYNTGKIESGNTRPSIKIKKLLNVHAKGLSQTSCLQMDRENIYLVYWALGEYEAGGVENPQGTKTLPPQEAIGDFGLSVKVWNFGVNNIDDS